MIKYHVNTTRKEMPIHVHQNIGSFWNAAEMKLHVNRTCFHAGLKFQTGMSSFWLSCERTLCNVIEIKNKEMIQSFLVERSWNQWSLSKKIFFTRRFRKKKMFSEIWPQSQGSKNSRTERKVDSVKQHGGLWRLLSWLRSLTKFAHNILRNV